MTGVVVDSSGWLEFFADGPNAESFASVLLGDAEITVPTICLYEVQRVTRRESNDLVAGLHVAAMSNRRVVDLDASLASDAAVAAERFSLGMADAIIYATAVRSSAELWTMDADFRDLAGVTYIAHG